MNIEEKYFPNDKNYLLKTVQAFSKEMLLDQWIRRILDTYMQMENPMGFEDDFTKSLRVNIFDSKKILDQCYDVVCAVYRLKFGDNQLSFIWDGRTHMEFYDEIWKDTFNDWMKKLCLKPEIYRGIIKSAISGDNVNLDFLQASVRRAIVKHFGVKLTRANKLSQVA